MRGWSNVVCGIARAALVLSLLVAARPLPAAVELAVLDNDNWDEYVPDGKEVDAILGDYVLRNENVVAVIGRPVAGRNANMTVKAVGGCLIDLTRRQRPNDQLSAYYPGGSSRSFTNPQQVRVSIDGAAVMSGDGRIGARALRGARIMLEIGADPVDGKPEVWTQYRLATNDEFVSVDTTYRNMGVEAYEEELNDAIRADRVFEFGTERATNLFWAADDWFGQAYGVIVPDRQVVRDKLLKLMRGGNATLRVEPGATAVVPRKIFPADHQVAMRGIARRLSGQPVVHAKFVVRDPAGPVRHARVSFVQDDEEYGYGRTRPDGTLDCELPPGPWNIKVEAQGRPPTTLRIERPSDAEQTIPLPASGYVRGDITDAAGRPIPCKVAFAAVSQGADPPRDKDGKLEPRRWIPYFGPDSGDVAVHNLVYSHNGQFRQEIPPGKYQVVVSLGPEYNAVFTQLDVLAGADAVLRAKLERTVDTKGWVSGDFHSHSTPSGDNVSSQLGRVLNLLAEQIEFAPCTEHNRIDSYAPHLKRLEASHLMATCTGIELTGAVLPVNHQNAFPLHRRPRTQDGGGPQIDINPVTQIERLALWDGGAEKVVQSNHPNLAQIYGDRDLDGMPDEGFRKMLSFMDVMEVHPIGDIFADPPNLPAGPKSPRNALFYWLQLLNLGYRIPGVVNSDAHYNFHGSGFVRNYVHSGTDDPARIDTLEMVREIERGHLTMSNGPFLEVSATAAEAPAAGGQTIALPGDDLVAPHGLVNLEVRVQCSNWLDVNRLQVFVNGRPASELNFTRRSHADRFQDGVIKFAGRIPVRLTADAHLIVAVAGEGLTLGPVMGPDHGKAMPVAFTNPIFVRLDGDKFRPNGDTLDLPLPGVK